MPDENRSVFEGSNGKNIGSKEERKNFGIRINLSSLVAIALLIAGACLCGYFYFIG